MTGVLLAAGLAGLAQMESGGREPAPWMRVAHAELNTRESSGPADNGRILEYHRTTTLVRSRDEVPWCSSFVNWCLLESNLPGTNSAWARSWLDWGDELCEPLPGSIVVLQGESPWEGHVGFLLESRGGDVVVLGGNQNDEVSIRPYPVGRVLGYRWPSRGPAAR